MRLGGRAISRALFAVGFLATATVAYQEWLAMHSLLVAGGILVAGLIVFGVLAWTVRGISFLFAFVLIAASFYLILYGWVGAPFVGTSLGELTWAGAAILTMIVTGLGGGRLRGAALPGAARAPH